MADPDDGSRCGRERLVRERRLLVTMDVVWATTIDDPWRHVRPVDAG